VKRSRAQSARVELWRDAAGVHLVVADDGQGMSADSGGLAGIEERVRLLGGRCELNSRPGQGTTWSVLLPSL